MIEIGEDNPDMAWVHSSWERWSEQISGLTGFRRLSNRDGLLIGTMPAEEIRLLEEMESTWEEEMFRAESAELPEPEFDLQPGVEPGEETTVMRVGGERPFWIEIETESPAWGEHLAAHPWAVLRYRSRGGFRERWLLPHALLRIG